MSAATAAAPRPSAISVAASWAFLLFVAALPWSIAAMSIGLALCATLTVADWLTAREKWRAPRPLLFPALGWLVAHAVAAAFAEDPAASFPRIAKGALPAIVWVAAYHARERGAGKRILGVLLVSAALAAALGLAVWIGKGAAFPERARGAAGHYMTFAGQLLLWLSVAAGVVLASRGRWRTSALAAALAGGLALAATFTRSAWLGTFTAFGVILGLARPRGLIALALGATLLVAVAPAAYRARLASAFDPAHASNIERTHMWEAGVRMFRDHPVNGVGLQDLHAAYRRYQPATAREPAGHLHNVFVQIAATMGIIGLLAFGWLYVSLAGLAAAGGRLGAPGLATGVRLGVLGALAGFLVAGLFEWNFGDEELLDLLYTLVGIAWAAGGWPRDDAKREAGS